MTIREHIHPGKAAFFSYVSDITGSGLVFEDDGECGFLYALNTEQKIEDAVFVYKVNHETNQRFLILEVVWSADGWKVRAQLDGSLVAAFHYKLRQSFSASKSPAPTAWNRVTREAAEAWFATRQ